MLSRISSLPALAACALAAALPLFAQTASRPAPPFDIVITNGHIIDGTGSPWYSGDVGIRDGRIAAIGNLDRRAAQSRPSTRTARSSRRDSSTCSASRS